jgi:hypothetical protein
MSARVEYGAPRPTRWAHITTESVSVNGYSTWGHRLTCATCGQVDESHGGSSVSYEDAPGRFAMAHRDCGPVTFDEFGRLSW